MAVVYNSIVINIESTSDLSLNPSPTSSVRHLADPFPKGEGNRKMLCLRGTLGQMNK